MRRLFSQNCFQEYANRNISVKFLEYDKLIIIYCLERCCSRGLFYILSVCVIRLHLQFTMFEANKKMFEGKNELFEDYRLIKTHLNVINTYIKFIYSNLKSSL